MDALFSSAEARVFKPLPTLYPRCDQCGLSEAGCHTPKMPVDGEGRRKILIVSDYPGREEDKQSRPFVGKSGQYLESTLRELNVSMRKDCWLTNATICYSPTVTKHKTAVVDCRPNVLRAIRELKPNVVLLLGSHAVRSVIGHVWKEDVGPLKWWYGHQIPNHKPNVWLCPSWNPAHLLREQKAAMDRAFKLHLKEAAEIESIPWPDGPPDYSFGVQVIYDPADAARRIRKYQDGNIAFDFETNMSKPDSRDAEIVCCSVCWNGTETIAFPWTGPAIAAMKELLTDPAVGKIGANIGFEDRWCRAKLGIEVRGWTHDTVLAAHTLDPRGGITGLKMQAFLRLGTPNYNSHIEPFLIPEKPGGNSMNRVREVKLSLLAKYCGMDSALEWHVAQHQMRELGISLN